MEIWKSCSFKEFYCVLAIKNMNNHTSGRLLMINYLDWIMNSEKINSSLP